MYTPARPTINPALARIVAEEGLGLDVVSGGELAVAQAVDFPPERVYFHGNNKGRSELEQALAWGIGRIVIDSFYELDLLEDMASAAGKTQEVLLRISPGIDPHTTTPRPPRASWTASSASPLKRTTPSGAVRQALKAPHLKLMGIQFHLGSPIFQLEPYRSAVDLALAFASGLREEGLDLKELSPGGGFAIAYTRQQQPPAVADYAEAIVSSLADGCQRLGLELPHLVIEPGRAISGPAGVALYGVGAVKDIPGVRRYVSVDGGMGDKHTARPLRSRLRGGGGQPDERGTNEQGDHSRQVLRVRGCSGARHSPAVHTGGRR